jgi:hypothetical protein
MNDIILSLESFQAKSQPDDKEIEMFKQKCLTNAYIQSKKIKYGYSNLTFFLPLVTFYCTKLMQDASYLGSVSIVTINFYDWPITAVGFYMVSHMCYCMPTDKPSHPLTFWLNSGGVFRFSFVCDQKISRQAVHFNGSLRVFGGDLFDIGFEGVDEYSVVNYILGYVLVFCGVHFS